MAVNCAVGKTQSMSSQVLQSWLKTGFSRGRQARGVKAGKTVWDLIRWGLERQAEAGINGSPLICERGRALGRAVMGRMEWEWNHRSGNQCRGCGNRQG